FSQTSDDFSIVACSGTRPLSASCGLLPAGHVGEPYAGQLAASGGAGSYNWSLASGTLPGLTLDFTGRITGIPSAPGAFPFTARVSDSSEQATTVSCTILATKPPLIVNTTRIALNAQAGDKPFST